MKKLIALLLLVPSVAFSQAIRRDRLEREQLYWTFSKSGTMSNTSKLSGTKRSFGFVVTSVVMYVNTASGGGAGTTVVTITDGTNNCTATLACTTSQTPGLYKVTTAGSCAYAANAVVTASVTTGSCTTTQPAVLTVDFLGIAR